MGEKVGRRNVLRLCIVILWLGTVLIAPPLMAYEGDYIWEDRFKAQVDKAKSGSAEAEYSLAEMYLGGRGTAVNEKDAQAWFLKAAKQGHIKAAYRVGYLYLHARTFTQSAKDALPWLIKASNAGFPAAQYELGLLYATGRGVKQDRPAALALLAKAKLHGYAPAREAFDHLVKGLIKHNSLSEPPTEVKPSPVGNNSLYTHAGKVAPRQSL